MSDDVPTVPARLAALLEQLEIVSTSRFRLGGGEPVEASSIALPPQPGAQPADSGQLESLRSAIAGLVYAAAYARDYAGQAISAELLRRPVVTDNGFVMALSAGNPTALRWEPGWSVFKTEPSGAVHVRKADAATLVQPGQYAFSAGFGRAATVGDSVDLLVPRESLTLQPGMYFAFGETVASDYDNARIGRLYFHAASDQAAWLLQNIATLLNRYAVPFRLKCPTDPAHFDRTDGMVLYVARRFVAAVLRLLAPLAPELRRRLQPSVPLCSKKLLPGLGAADDPGTGESFGQSRSRIVADGIVDAWQQGRSNVQERYEAIIARFTRAGVSPLRPWLVSGLTDPYFLPMTEGTD